MTLIQVLDREEISPTLNGYLALKDVETGGMKKITIDGTLSALYHDKIRNFLEKIRAFCFTRGIDYYLSDTRTPFEDFLLDYLTKGARFH